MTALKNISVLFAIVVFLGCTRHAYHSTNKAYKQQVKALADQYREYPVSDSAGLHFAEEWVGSPHFSPRRPNFVVIHHTAQNSCEQTLKTFTSDRTETSSHYVICRDGTVHHMLNDLLRGHHAGVSKWGSNTDLNSSSVGIELDNNGFEPFPEPQIRSLLEVLGRLKRAYNIPTANFIGHADVAPGRKVDPSRYFPWERLSVQGFGFWYDTSAVSVPADFNAMQALRVIGYDTRNAGNAIQSYKIHFVPQDTTKLISESDRKILAALLLRYQ
jgi:N-acetylmuramoyl-L-alanine amidase